MRIPPRTGTVPNGYLGIYPRDCKGQLFGRFFLALFFLVALFGHRE